MEVELKVGTFPVELLAQRSRTHGGQGTANTNEVFSPYDTYIEGLIASADH